MIPKIIHYCWFGSNDMPQVLLECLDTWKLLENNGYKIIRWDESNCTFDECEFVKKAYAEKKWAYVSDYYRLKALKEYGGIYLDTDVKVNKDCSPLLNNKCFLGYMVDCCVGTAVIGAEPKSILINNLLHMYDITCFVDDRSKWEYDFKNDCLVTGRFETNNWYFMKYLLCKYPMISLKNKYQEFPEFTIYPKEYFEIGMLSGRHYTVHLNSGSWQNKKEDRNFYSKLKNKLLGMCVIGDKIQIIVRKKRYKKMNKNNVFYKYSKSR